MIARLRARWSLLTLRERGLIVVMLALMAIVLLWLAVVRPVQDGLVRAAADQAVAVERAGRIAGLVDALKRGPTTASRLDGALDQVVAQSAGEAGFTLDTAQLAGPDRMTIAIAAARPTALFSWLAALETRGVAVESIAITPGAFPGGASAGVGAAGGTVGARATLRAVR